MWTTYVRKGDHLNCVMVATDTGAGFLLEDTRKPPSAASPWSGDLKHELSKWGWHESDNDKGWDCDYERMRLGNAFKGLGLNAKSKYEDDGDPADGDNECFSITHYDKENAKDPDAEWPQMKPVTEQKYKVNGKEFMSTGAYYEFAINNKGGGIIGKNLQSPVVAVIDRENWGRKAAESELPEIRFASDVYWGYWFRDNPNIKNLRVYGADNVVNDATVLLVARAFKNNKIDKLTPWPGVSFAKDSDEGKALIGSPIGATIAHLIARHKSDLGIKRISNVIVVTNDEPARPKFGERPRKDLHLFYQIEDVPADDIPEDKPENTRLVSSRSLGARNRLRMRHEMKDGLRIHTFSY
ncbi:hypothetical protein BDU57DRAFT_476936 [Ampelomyces quisqualis]|uniref:Uncharacterized protein n=1 Tax=Ampelomyces quisqualis TaxID=50730 RepID=A0A6A5QLG4_AMPQU|nr:hypothetical protein BDU57DRAFT_476936 [Ampelomyces quisqualis]